METYGTGEDPVSGNCEVWLAERPERFGGTWALGCLWCRESKLKRKAGSISSTSHADAASRDDRRLSGHEAGIDGPLCRPARAIGQPARHVGLLARQVLDAHDRAAGSCGVTRKSSWRARRMQQAVAVHTCAALLSHLRQAVCKLSIETGAALHISHRSAFAQ